MAEHYLFSSHAGPLGHIYNPGDGEDSIIDSAGDDVLTFGAGIDPEDVEVEADDDAFILTFTNGGGSLELVDALLPGNEIEEIHFANSVVWTVEDLYTAAALFI